MTKCCECSRVLADGASFCPFCGSAQGKDASSDDTSDHSSRRPTKRGTQTKAMDRRQEIGRANTIVATHTSNDSALGNANTMRKSLSSDKRTSGHKDSSERPTIVRQAPSEDSSGIEASQASNEMVDTAPELVDAEKLPTRSTQDIQGRSISISPQIKSVVEPFGSDEIVTSSILSDLDATDHSGSGDYMSNLANSTQAIEMTQEMLDAMDQHAAQIQQSKENLLQADPALEKPGLMEATPELRSEQSKDPGVADTSAPERSEAEGAQSSESGPQRVRDNAEAPVVRVPESRSLTTNPPPAVRPSRVETPFDRVLEYALANKLWTIPVAIVVLALALFLAESLR